MSWRVVFLGTPQFAVPSLAALVADERFDIALVVSQPSRPAGRGRRLTAPPVATFALEKGLSLLQPVSLRDADSLSRLEAVQPDLLVVVAYGEILRRNVLHLSSSGALNVHPSLLPKYRGASPIAGAIRSGDPQTGVSIMKLVRKLDAGPVVAQTTVPIESTDTTGTLGDRLARTAAEMLPDVCHDWLAGNLVVVEQDESEATYTREWTKADAEIDWTKPAQDIEYLIRAALPWPIAWTSFHGQRLQVRRAEVAADSLAAPGTILQSGKRLIVGTGENALELEIVQPEGKREMPALGWWNGLHLKPGSFGT